MTLTRIEFSLFHLLTTHPGRIYSRGQLMTTMYGDQRIVSERTIDSHIKKLRNKLKLLNTDEMIESSYGAGYRYVGMKVSVYTG
ncbi:MAG: winged helix-turn-helix domain-containing protein [Shewanella fodinae]|nr:winged helix-turn-helix domain-containing protein [Shewanella fodinae]